MAVSISDAARAAVKVRMACPHVAEVSLDRVDKHNAMTIDMFLRIGEAFSEITRSITESVDDDKNPLQDVRCVILTSASPKVFSAGIDFQSAAEITAANTRDDAARTGFRTYHFVRKLQDAFSAVADCPVPVIAAIHGPCIGAGVDLITACDIRLATAKASFCVKEVDVGITADLGTLQRLPQIVGNQSLVREWCFTARNISADEAARAGLVSRLVDTNEGDGSSAVREAALAMAKVIAQKPPLAVAGTKASLNFAVEAQAQQGLRHVALFNGAALQCEDIPKTMMAPKKKQGTDSKPVTFSKL
jgi:delta(3,5)-delta(2,4)-dienoyl-CoA isomerase